MYHWHCKVSSHGLSYHYFSFEAVVIYKIFIAYTSEARATLEAQKFVRESQGFAENGYLTNSPTQLADCLSEASLKEPHRQRAGIVKIPQGCFDVDYFKSLI